MRRRELMLLLGGTAAAALPVATQTRAQQQRRIGFLSSVSADGVRSSLADFSRGLNETGYKKGRNLLIEYRWADGDFARLPALAADLVRTNVEVIVTVGGPQPARAAMQATPAIPIVASSAGGLVKHFNRPDRNLTGVSIPTSGLTPKRLQILAELVPGAAIGVLMNPTSSTYEQDRTAIESAARTLGVELHVANADADAEFESALASLIRLRVGALLIYADPFFNRHGMFREALRRLGYIDGQTIVMELRYGESRPDRLLILARELVALAPAVIVCVGRQETVALQAATHTIPIVFIQVADPVAMGLVATLARPGGNTTGFTQMSADLDSKRLELLHEIAPGVSRAVFLINPSLTPGLAKRFAGAEAAAKTLGIALRRLDAATPAELSAALATIDASSGEALLVQNDPMLTGTEGSRIRDFAVAYRLPTVFETKGSMAAAGGLLSYGPDLSENAWLAAGYVDKILKGARPADLPVQQPTRFELVVSLRTAEAIGLTIPQSIIDRADAVIE